MTLTEYAAYDALGLADLVAKKQVSPKELAQTAAIAIDAINPIVNAVIETYADRIDGLNEATLGTGPFRGVPFLMKDVFGHEAGRRIEWGSRLCRGMVAKQDSHLCELFKAAGLNILGRSAAPEYSMSGTTESVLHGNTSTPWKRGYSAGGSTGGGMAAVMAGIVPIAHGSDIAGSIRIPASVCGGVGLKPSRGRVSFGPMLDENGFGLGQNFVQAKTVRDAAAMLEPVILKIYEHARTMNAAQFLNALASINTARRQLGRYFTKYDVWLCPTTPRVAEPWGTYSLGRTDVTIDDLAEKIFAGTCQFTLPHNILGVPAISLPLAMHSSGVPIGIQLGSTAATEHVVLQLATALEEAMPWNDRVPPLHVSRVVSAQQR